MLNRRAALARAFALSAGASAFLCARPSSAAQAVCFAHDPYKLGVASGDPSADGFVAWTRLAPQPFEADGGLGDASVEVAWEVAADPGFKRLVRTGVETAHPGRAHAVHAEVRGLEPDRPYWYRFVAGGVRSPVGRSATLPAPGAPKARLKLAWASCQHFEHGWFTPYRDMVAWAPDLILHLGDYIYESSYGPQVRRHGTPFPITLDEYRVHHAVYKLDADLQAAHAAAPWAMIWDDHEVENDYAGLTPQNPADAGDFPARRAAAYQAYFEHLPLSRRTVLTRGQMRLFQQLTVGDLVQFMLLDTRQHRAPRACVTPQRWRSTVVDCPELYAEDRTILGADQEWWLSTALNENPARWSTLVQPTLFSHLDQRTSAGNRGGFNDGWSGYPVARQQILDRIAARGVKDVVFLGGDMHAFWVADVPGKGLDNTSAPVATEFVGTSITSRSTSFARFNRIIAEGENGHVRFFDDRVRGWAAAEIDRDRFAVAFRTVDSVATRTPLFSTLNRWVVERGEVGAKPG